MNTPITRLALCTCLLALAACEKTPPLPPQPIVQTMPSTPADAPSMAASGVGSDPTVSSAASPLPPASGPTPDTPPSRTDGTRNPAQASQGAPLPGQNNDHSAPLRPGQAASTP